MNEKTIRNPGRPPLSSEGKRRTLHIALSPLAVRTLDRLCFRPIEPISHSAMIEFLILQDSQTAITEPIAVNNLSSEGS
jgi:hypothetical protein